MKKRLLAMIMTLAMCLSLLPTAAFAAEAEDLQARNQIEGNYNYYAYDASRKAFETEGNTEAVVKNNESAPKVTISKTIAPTGTENQFDITLNVKTSEFVEETNPDTNAAVVLVMDISQSMDLCAECGSKDREQKPIKKMKDGIEVCANKDCSVYEESFVSRMDAAKEAADDFLRSYAGFEGETYTDPGASRYVSIVAYGKNTNTIVVDWQDIHKETREATNNALNALKAEIAAFDNNVVMSYQDRCGTNTDAGLKQAEEELGENTINGINNKFVVLLTDGEPSATAQNQLSGDGYTLPNPYPSGYSGNKYIYPAMRAMHIRTVEKAMFYSISFAAGENVSAWMNSFSDKCVTADGSSQLTVAFDEILIRMMLGVYAWKVTDPMGEYITYEGYENSTGHAAAAVSFNGTSKTLIWDLSEDLKGATTVIKDDKDTVVTYDNYKASDGLNCTVEYTLTYRVSLDVAAMVAKKHNMEEYVLTNGATSLAYYLTQTNSDGNVKYLDDNGDEIGEGGEKLLTMYFKVPKVRGYAGNLSFAKVDENRNPLAGATFTLTGTNGFEKSGTSVDVEEGATTNNNVTNVTISDIPSGATYTLEETGVPEDYQENNTTYTVDVNYGVATLKEGSDVITQIQNTPTAPTTGSLTIEKVYADDSDYTDSNKEFTFVITNSNGYSNTVTVKAGERKTIDELSLGEYTVVEQDADVDYYTLTTKYDGEVAPNGMIVTIDDDENNAAVVTVTNNYTAIDPTDAELTISGTKSVNGTGAPSDTFTFQLKNGDSVVDTKTTTGAGTFSFNKLTFDRVGTYTYTVSEVAVGNAKWAYDNTVYTVTVDVTKDASKNELVATYKVDDETNKPIAFTNTFTPANGQLTITKVDDANQDTTLAGAEFTLTPNGEGEAITATSNDQGVATFANIPLGTYTLTEATAPVGYSKDPATYDVTVSVDAQGDTITTVKKGNDVVSSDGAITITNVQQVANTTIAKAANKDEAYAPGETVTYTVTLTNSGNIADTVTVVDTLPAALVDATEHNITATDATVSYENYTITWNSVTVPAGKTTTLTYTVVIPENVTLGEHANTVAIRGTNKTDSETIQVEAAKLTATKEAAPTVAPGGTLTYTIKVTNDGNKAAEGVVISDVIPADLTLVANSYGTGALSKDGKTITWTVNVKANETVPVSFQATVPADAENGTEYKNVAVVDGHNTNETVTEVDSQSVTIGGTKFVKQGGNVAAPTTEKFTFTLTEQVDEGKVAYTETVTADAGAFAFSAIKYTEPGTYVYKVSETKGSAADWTYDSTVYTVTVNVDRGSDGKLVAKVDGNEGITFTNTYTKTQSTGGGSYTPNIPDNPPALNKVDHFAYIVGYPDGNVMPNGNITRAEVATIFFRMLTDESRDEFWSQSSDYSDVTATKWFNNAVCTLSNGGIITGYADGTFKPNGNITRAEFATMAVRFFSASYEGESLFPDIDQHWAKDYINTAAYEGLINGYEDGTFRPNQPITRAEAMAIVNRVLDRHPDKANLLEDMIQWPDNMDTEKWYYADVQEATNSHDYDMEGTEAEPYEVWTEILPVRDWVAFEKEWSDSNSAEGGEVMK